MKTLFTGDDLDLTTNEQNVCNSFVLLDYLESIKHSLGGRYGVYFNISKLSPYNQTSDHLKNIKMNLRSALGYMGTAADIFALKNNDYIFIVNDISIISLERIILRFKKTFLGDPFLREGMAVESFYRIYDLGKEGHEFYKLVEFIGEEIREDLLIIDSYDSTTTLSTLNIKEGIDTKTLTLIQNILKQANATNYVRRQPICWIDADLIPHPLHYQYFLSVQLLQEVLKLKEKLADNIWLFKHLTALFDKMMLNLTKDLITQKTAPSLFLNISLRTIGTPLFYDYINKFYQQKELTIELDVLDILAHYDAYLFACEFAQKYNYKICINGINLLNYHIINLDLVEKNWVKLSSAILMDNLTNNSELKNWIDKINPEKIILHHCGSKSIIEEGLKYKIHLFQGFAIDAILKEKKS